MFYTEPDQQDLRQLFHSLTNDYGEVVRTLTRSFTEHTTRLEGYEQYNIYVAPCLSLISKISDYLLFRSEVLHPYMNELQEKKESGHNCQQCAGKCNVQHQLQIANAIYTTREIKQLLSSVFESFPIPENIKQDAVYKKQRMSLMRLDNAVTELLYMEEIHLMPAILKAQTDINAVG